MPDFINMSPTTIITDSMRSDSVDIAPPLARTLCPRHDVASMPVQTERSYAPTGLPGYRVTALMNFSCLRLTTRLDFLDIPEDQRSIKFDIQTIPPGAAT